MMENQGYEESHLYASREDMESLVLNDPLPSPLSSPSLSASNGHKLSDHHPLSSPADDSDDNSSSNRTSSPLMHPLNPNSRAVSSSLNSMLDPPSYADVIYTSFSSSISNSKNGDGDVYVVAGTDDEDDDEYDDAVVVAVTSGLEGGSSSSRSDFLDVSVLYPQKEQDLAASIVPGGNTYYTYLVTTKTNIPEYGGTEFSVRRRFKDVVALSDRLSECYRGFFVPLRPDKNVVESQVMQKHEFVEQRRGALEKYLRKLADHPVIKKSEDLRLFLQVQGRLSTPKSNDVVSRTVDGNDAPQAAKSGWDYFRVFKEFKQSVTNDWGNSKPALVEEDKDFMEKRAKIQDYEQQLSNVSQQAELLVKAQQDIGETMGELGLTFVKLTKFETGAAVYNSQRVRSADMKNVATSAVKVSRLYRELNAQTVKHLDKLHQYLGVMLAVNNAFSDRSSALLTVQTLLSDISSLQSRIEKQEVASSKIFGGDRSRNQKTEELKEILRKTEEAKRCAVKEYEQIKENNKTELERLDKERRNDLLNMLKGFVVNQVGYAEKMANVWETVAKDTSGYIGNSS